MARDPIKITCPHCGSLYQLADGTIKEVVRSELVNADESDFEAPVRELIYKILEKGGANELATNLVDMATGKEVAMNVKLRALDIIGSLFKHSEKLSPPERNLDDLDREELQAYVDRKMGVAAPPLASSGPAPPKWLQVEEDEFRSDAGRGGGTDDGEAERKEVVCEGGHGEGAGTGRSLLRYFLCCSPCRPDPRQGNMGGLPDQAAKSED
jgi:hypothetical protein